MVSQETISNLLCSVLVLFLFELVTSAPQGYNYYSNQQRTNAQRIQAQRLQAQRRQAAQNRYQQSYTATTRSPYRHTISRADSENAKFLGTQNQEREDTGKTLGLIRRKKQFLYGGGGGGNPCYFRSADQQPAEGRFLWDLNVYNVYPTSYGGGNGCGGFNGGGGFGGGFNGNLGARPFGGFFQNFLSLFVPGGVLSPNRPLQTNVQSDSIGSNRPQNVLNDLDYDPSLGGTGSGGSTGTVGSTTNSVNPATSLTPGELVGGVASTVNGIIQTLSGNTRPAYRRYG